MSLPALPETSESVEEKFTRLALVWDADTCYYSDTTRAVAHPAYQEIIGLGPAVVPLLLRDMERTHQHWFEALRKITGADPVPSSVAGRIPKMVAAWLQWGRENGYQW
jgi:hypothetical protein